MECLIQSSPKDKGSNMARSKKVPHRRAVKREKMERRHLEKTKVLAHPRTFILSNPRKAGIMDWNKLKPAPAKEVRAKAIPEQALGRIGSVDNREIVKVVKGQEWFIMQEVLGGVKVTGRWIDRKTGVLGKIKEYTRGSRSAGRLLSRLLNDGFKVSYSSGEAEPEGEQ